ncbi:MAG: arsenosugar biosynthesis radical SAM protein ArsS [Bdellovibrionales bacterium]|nr:arsenosugar biosynthesis radical SAM protein ArsS [Bdellovibrionales bacterium]
MGKLCNQACQHCHVEAGPQRTENMELTTVEACLRLARDAKIAVVDITGGAPELNPHFRYFVSELSHCGVQVIDRCNLTVLWEPGQQDTAEFLASHEVRIIASLPCYSEANVRKQRGSGVFDKSIRALQRLNELGYGKGALVLDLVYNPTGAFLPPEQSALETTYKKRLREDFGIHFNRLFTLTNMPIKRFAQTLIRQGAYDEYLDRLTQAFNPSSVDGLMCRDLISVGYDGTLYDCDFNQMLEIPLAAQAKTIFELDYKSLEGAPIATNRHCFGCTAGSGSSCTGALA